ncbi:MAG: RDD family protein [Steroidobacteraceae bacterium]
MQSAPAFFWAWLACAPQLAEDDAAAMTRQSARGQIMPGNFSSHETRHQHALNGVPLASFQARAAAILIDLVLLNLAMWPANRLLSRLFPDFAANAEHAHVVRFGHENFVVVGAGTWWVLPILIGYFGLATWIGKGRTPGKWLLGIRVMPLASEKLGLWHCVERALGYAASGLELGFGFLQYFIHPNAQTVHDRIAETIVIREPRRRQAAHVGPRDPAPPAT